MSLALDNREITLLVCGLRHQIAIVEPIATGRDDARAVRAGITAEKITEAIGVRDEMEALVLKLLGGAP